jgi:hypothetical protein
MFEETISMKKNILKTFRGLLSGLLLLLAFGCNNNANDNDNSAPSEPPTALSYSTQSAVYAPNSTITPNTPTVTGTVASWSIDPSLSTGLTLDTTTGIISGTPTESQLATAYIITASNAYGSTTTTISITVKIILMGWDLDETNTGLAGVGLTEDDLTVLTDFTDIGYLNNNTLVITHNNVTISNKIIPYSINCQATGTDYTGLTLNKCLIQPTVGGGGMPLILILDGSTMTDCNLDASLILAANVYAGVSVSGSCNFSRCNIWGMSTGMQIYNSGGDTLVEGNYIHGLRYVSPAHIDGMTIRSATGTSTTIRNNRVVADVPCTGAMLIQSNGYIDNVLLEGNLFEGDGHNIELEKSTETYGSNMQCINNRCNLYSVTGGTGFSEVWTDSPGFSVWDENYKYDSNAESGKGAVIDYP